MRRPTMLSSRTGTMPSQRIADQTEDGYSLPNTGTLLSNRDRESPYSSVRAIVARLDAAASAAAASERATSMRRVKPRLAFTETNLDVNTDDMVMPSYYDIAPNLWDEEPFMSGVSGQRNPLHEPIPDIFGTNSSVTDSLIGGGDGKGFDYVDVLTETDFSSKESQTDVVRLNNQFGEAEASDDEDTDAEDSRDKEDDNEAHTDTLILNKKTLRRVSSTMSSTDVVILEDPSRSRPPSRKPTPSKVDSYSRSVSSTPVRNTSSSNMSPANPKSPLGLSLVNAITPRFNDVIITGDNWNTFSETAQGATSVNVLLQHTLEETDLGPTYASNTEYLRNLAQSFGAPDLIYYNEEDFVAGPDSSSRSKGPYLDPE